MQRHHTLAALKQHACRRVEERSCLTMADAAWKLSVQRQALRRWTVSQIHRNQDAAVACIAMLRMIQFKISRALTRWLRPVRARRLAVLHPAGMKMLHRQLARGFVQWTVQAARARKQSRLLVGPLNRMRNLVLSQAWQHWQYAYRELWRAAGRLHLVRIAALRLMHRRLARAFITWVCITPVITVINHMSNYCNYDLQLHSSNAVDSRWGSR